MRDEIAVPAPAAQQRAPGSSWKLYLLLAVCLAPVVASYLMYYVFPPTDRSNYGTLLEPQRPVPVLDATVLHAPHGAAARGEPALAMLQAQGLSAFKGRWVMLAIDQGGCTLPCAQKLFFMRQTHVSLGKERDRVARVLLVTDFSPVPAGILAAHPDMTVFRVTPHDLAVFFPVTGDTELSDHVYLIDPRHDLMMRFPKDPDPGRTRNDLQRLMRASRIG